MAPDLYGISSATTDNLGTDAAVYKANSARSCDFYLAYLESTEYNPIEAAEKILTNFHFKERLFGIEKVHKIITLDDLSPKDIEALESGMLMWLPSTDMAGRQVVQCTFGFATLENWENHERVNYYIMMTGLLNQTKRSRKLGFVFLSDNTESDFSRQMLSNITTWALMYMSFPGIIRSIHFSLKSSYLLDQVKGERTEQDGQCQFLHQEDQGDGEHDLQHLAPTAVAFEQLVEDVGVSKF